VDDALLAGDAADEQRVRAIRLDAEPADDVRVLDRPVGLGVHPVADDLHPSRIQVGIGVEHVGLHAVADRDHRVGREVRRPLHPGRQPVAAAELVGLPRPARLQRVRGDDVRDAVHEGGEEPGGIGVPGVGVHEVGPGQAGGHLDVDAESLQRPVRVGEPGRDAVRRRVVARSAEAVDVDVRPGRQGAERGHEVLHVDTRAAVDVRWPLPRCDADTHERHPRGRIRTRQGAEAQPTG
jgi:hypothetical protein